jgi:NMD protein affecting ribosome stability and mRNA decay
VIAKLQRENLRLVETIVAMVMNCDERAIGWKSSKGKGSDFEVGARNEARAIAALLREVLDVRTKGAADNFSGAVLERLRQVVDSEIGE